MLIFLSTLNMMVRELFYEKTRILLTIMAIAWGTFAIASMLSIGEGLRLTFTKAVSSVGHNLLDITGGRTSKAYRGRPSNTAINLLKDDLNNIAQLPSVVDVSPQYSIGAKFFYKSKSTRATVKAVSAGYLAIHRVEVAPGGRFLSMVDMKEASNVIVLGTKTNDDLFGKNRDALDQIVMVDSQPFRVVGVALKKAKLAAIGEPVDYLNWIPATTYEALAGPYAIDSISLTYKDGTDFSSLTQQIRQAVALHHDFDPTDISVIDFIDIVKAQQTVTNLFVGMQIFLGLIGALTLLIAGVGIANVMYASVQRATREIGIRMALGAKTYQILTQYILESCIATLIGGFIGIVASAVVIVGMNYVPLSSRIVSVAGKPHAVLSPLVVAIVIIALGVIGILSGLFPALRASKIDPAEALRHE